jgi:hypothetical protein
MISSVICVEEAFSIVWLFAGSLRAGSSVSAGKSPPVSGQSLESLTFARQRSQFLPTEHGALPGAVSSAKKKNLAVSAPNRPTRYLTT